MEFKETFKLSAGSASKVRNPFIMIEGNYFGEASRSIYYGPDDKQIERDLEHCVSVLSTRNALSFEDLNELNNLDVTPQVKNAIITAALHYVSGLEKRYPWEIMGIDAPGRISTSVTIGIDRIENVISKIKDSDYAILKIKLGYNDDVLLASKLSDFPDKMFRVDANGAWNPEKCEEMIYYLSKCNIEVVEQPTDLEHIKDWPSLKGQCKASFIIDEDMASCDDYYKYADYIDGINIKMAKSGGLIEAIKLAELASKDRLKIMLGCMVESSIGISPALYMASMGDYFDLDGPLLLKTYISDDIIYKNDKILIDENIIGGPKIKKGLLPC